MDVSAVGTSIRIFRYETRWSKEVHRVRLRRWARSIRWTSFPKTRYFQRSVHATYSAQGCKRLRERKKTVQIGPSQIAHKSGRMNIYRNKKTVSM